ncbi:MAG: methyltransferase domain-containing protein [Candidatus Lokiarchaeota archaeon]|nr:methyltransferase domain-containing protein [Candidatus Lokiarchaeota archaeon]
MGPNKTGKESGTDVLQWHEMKDMWQLMAPVVFPPGLLDTTESDVKGLIDLLDLNPTDRVLDLCCGYGRHTLEMSSRGYDVVGVDINDYFIEQARKAASEENLPAEFRIGDMRKFCEPDSFDVAINMYGSFGYFADYRDEILVLKNIYKSLKSPGKLLIDLWAKKIVLQLFPQRSEMESGRGLYVIESNVIENETKLRTSWKLLDRNGIWHEWVSVQNLYSAGELEDMLEECDFSGMKTYGSFKGTEYDANAERLIMTALKQ